MERTTRALLFSVLLTGVLTLAAFGWAAVPPPAGLPARSDDVEIALSSRPEVEGEPHENVTGIWIAQVTAVTRNESLEAYEVVLKVNGSAMIGPVAVRPGEIGRAGDVVLEFFDNGAYCSPVPCPLPDGPDGKLGVDDYLRISNAAPRTTYTLNILWAQTGRLVGEVIIET